MKVPSTWLRTAVERIFAAQGFSPQAATTIAEGLVEADLRGVSSHGVLLVPMYVERLARGSVSRREAAEVVVDSGAVAVLDAHHAMGQLTSRQAMDLAIERAKRHGLGAVAVRRAHHFGAASVYALQAVEAGCVGIVASNTTPLMPAPGGAAKLVGNNPLAIGAPVGDGPPLLLDMALSAAALGKIRLAAQVGQPIPDTWATDDSGTPTTDPAAAIAGMLLPAAGHKGFGLALMIDVLAGLLSGGAWGPDVRSLYQHLDEPNNCAHFFLALDVASFTDPGEFRRRADELAAAVRRSPRAPGVERLYTPGEPEWERRERQLREGVEADRVVVDELLACAGRLGVALEPLPGSQGVPR